jgi:hypothetical protein
VFKHTSSPYSFGEVMALTALLTSDIVGVIGGLAALMTAID